MNRFLFSEGKKCCNLEHFMVFSLFLYKICILNYYCSWSDKAPMSPRSILNVDLSYLPKCTEFLFRFEKKKPVSNFTSDRFSYRGSKN